MIDHLWQRASDGSKVVVRLTPNMKSNPRDARSRCQICFGFDNSVIIDGPNLNISARSDTRVATTARPRPLHARTERAQNRR